MSNARMSHTGFVVVGDGRLYYEERGDGQPVILIHAGIADSRMWDPQIEPLAAMHRVIRFDLRGFGQTVIGSGSFADSEDVEQIFDTLDVGPAVIVGASMGARVAVEFALRRPDLVRGLVLVAPGLFFDNPRSYALLAGWEAMGQAFEAGDPGRALEIELGLWIDGPRRAPSQVSPALRERVREMNTRVFELMGGDAGRQTMTPPAVERLAEIHVPTLVVIGDEDQLDIQAIANRLADEIAGARKVVIDDAAHMVTMEHPVVFNLLITQFLDDWTG